MVDMYIKLRAAGILTILLAVIIPIYLVHHAICVPYIGDHFTHDHLVLITPKSQYSCTRPGPWIKLRNRGCGPGLPGEPSVRTMKFGLTAEDLVLTQQHSEVINYA